VARTELVTCLLEGIADAVTSDSPHRLVKRVLPTELIDIKLVWHTLARIHAAHEWLRAEIIKICASLNRERQGVVSRAVRPAASRPRRVNGKGTRRRSWLSHER
jgi:hypothetical protein